MGKKRKMEQMGHLISAAQKIYSLNKRVMTKDEAIEKAYQTMRERFGDDDLTSDEKKKASIYIL